MISFIFAMDEKGVIGKDNQLPWHIPDDLKRFKKITMGHPIIMGRKTYDSIGKPLPGRENIILTTNQDFRADGCTVFYDLESCLQYINDNNNEEFFVIGGAEIFKLFIPLVNKIYLTKIHHSFGGDVYLPELNWHDFEPISSEVGPKEEKVPYSYEYINYVRK